MLIFFSGQKYLNGKMPLIGQLVCSFNKTPSKLEENQKYFIMVTLMQANKQHIGTPKIWKLPLTE